MKFAGVVVSAAGLAVSLQYVGRCHAFSPASHTKASLRRTSSSKSATDDGSAAVLESPAASDSEDATDERSLTQRMMEQKPSKASGQTGGAGGVSTWEALQRAEANWSRLKSSKAFEYDVTNLSAIQNGIPPPPQFVTEDGAAGNPKCWAKLRSSQNESAELDFDVTICGGTLGIFIAMALQLQGHRVAVIEAGKLMGREQEWNISRQELEELVELGVLTTEDVEEAVTTEFPGCRAGFKNSEGELCYLYFVTVVMIV